MKSLCIGLVALLGGSSAMLPPTGDDWVQIWGDEFGPVPADCGGAPVDCHKWNTLWQGKPKRTGALTWAHSAAYTEVRDGALGLFFQKLGTGQAGAGYITSHGIFGTTYGYFEARIKAPETVNGQAAFWLQPFAGDGSLVANDRVADSAADGAEIDILESKRQPDAYSAGILCDNYRMQPNICHDTRDNALPAPGFRRDYHVYALNWTPTTLEFLYDGKVVHRLTDPRRIVQVAERIILSVGITHQRMDRELDAEGGTNKDTRVDWVRVYKDNRMDWGDGFFSIINRQTGEALTAGQAGLVGAPYDAGNKAQLWQIRKDDACAGDIYSFKALASGGFMDADPEKEGMIVLAPSAPCHWSIRFAANVDGRDYYRISTGKQGTQLFSGVKLAPALMGSREQGGEWQIVWGRN